MLTTKSKKFAFGCLYLFFEAYPIVFDKPHHLSAGIAGLMFLPIAMGGTIAVIVVKFFVSFSSLSDGILNILSLFSSTFSFSIHGMQGKRKSMLRIRSLQNFDWR